MISLNARDLRMLPTWLIAALHKLLGADSLEDRRSINRCDLIALMNFLAIESRSADCQILYDKRFLVEEDS